MLIKLLSVFIGGGIGSLARFAVNELFVLNNIKQTHYATLLVNLLGCLLIGFLFTIFEQKNILNPQVRLLLVVGFCGGFTTFSAFALEALQLSQNISHINSFTYILASVIFCYIAVIVGVHFGKYV